jgi:hypothetical protein
MPNNDVNERKRKIYQKPEITIIDLAADEVLAGGCKTVSTTAAPGTPFCVAMGGCASIGS